MDNLIIIGNGFDLAHKLETSYQQFIKYLVESNYDKTKHLELFTRGLLMNYEKLKEANSIFYSCDTIKNYLLKKIFQNHFLRNWSDVEELYFQQLNSIGKPHTFYETPESLNEDFDQIKSALETYLYEQESQSSKIESYNTMFKTLDDKNTLILNFNYTKTIDRLYSSSLTKSKKLYFHGKLDTTNNPIVFGYAASHEDSRKLIEKNNNQYMKNIKKHLYKRTANEAILTEYLNDHNQISVLILGHSCGLSDKLILNQILTHEHVETIRTFYFEKYENYFDTMVNIDRIMNDDEKFRKRVIDFSRSRRMPQHYDEQTQIDEFTKYINAFRDYQIKKATS